MQLKFIVCVVLSLASSTSGVAKLENGKTYNVDILVRCCCGGEGTDEYSNIYVILNERIYQNKKEIYYGKGIIGNRNMAKTGTGSPDADFKAIGYEVYESSKTKQLQVEVWDRDESFGDDFLGQTDWFDIFYQDKKIHLVQKSSKNGKAGEVKQCGVNECQGNGAPNIKIQLTAR